MDYTIIQVRIPREFDYQLNISLAELKRDRKKKTKADLVLELAQRGYSEMYHNDSQG